MRKRSKCQLKEHVFPMHHRQGSHDFVASARPAQPFPFARRRWNWSEPVWLSASLTLQNFVLCLLFLCSPSKPFFPTIPRLVNFGIKYQSFPGGGQDRHFPIIWCPIILRVFPKKSNWEKVKAFHTHRLSIPAEPESQKPYNALQCFNFLTEIIVHRVLIC